MKAGKHVLVEKPMAVSLEECDEMLRVQRETGCALEVVSQNRYTEGNWSLKAILDLGIAGKIRFGQVESFWHRGDNYYNKPWRGKWETEGGGCTLNHAVHQIDLLNWIMGPPKTVTAVLKKVSNTRAQTEDVSAAILTYHDGAVVTLASSLVVHGEGQRLLFQCEKAGLGTPWNVMSSTSDINGFPVKDTNFEKKLEEVYNSIPKLLYTGHCGTIHHMLCLLEGRSQPEKELKQESGGIDGRLALEVIAAIYQSGFTGKTISLPLERDAFFYKRSGQEILSKERGLEI